MVFENFFGGRENTVKPSARPMSTTPPAPEKETNPDILEAQHQIRNISFHRDTALRRKAQAELEVASIQKSWGAPPSDYEVLATRHLEEAEEEVKVLTEKLDAAKARLVELQN